MRVALADNGAPVGDAQLVHMQLSRDSFTTDETIAAADIVQNQTQLQVALTMSSGRILFIETGEPPREVATIPIATIGLAGLYPSGGGVYLVHPSESHGMQHTIVKEPLPRM